PADLELEDEQREEELQPQAGGEGPPAHGPQVGREDGDGAEKTDDAAQRLAARAELFLGVIGERREQHDAGGEAEPPGERRGGEPGCRWGGHGWLLAVGHRLWLSGAG